MIFGIVASAVLFFFNTPQAKVIMSRALDTFITKEEQRVSSARGNGKFQPVNQKILSACLSKYRLFAINDILLLYL